MISHITSLPKWMVMSIRQKTGAIRYIVGYLSGKSAKINDSASIYMNISLKHIHEVQCRCDALILPFMEGEEAAHEDLGPVMSGYIKRFFLKVFDASNGKFLLLPAPENISSSWILLAGLGKRGEITQERVRQAGGRAVSSLRGLRIKKAAVSGRSLSAAGISPSCFLEGFLLALYAFHKYSNEPHKETIRSIAMLSRESKKLKSEISEIQTLTSAVAFSKDLINTPSNDMTPAHLAKAARSLTHKQMSVSVMNEKEVRKLGMGAYLSVAKGSDEPLKFIVLKYKGGSKAPVVLIGKSVTFDSGGLSLKPSAGMEKMKYDMAGGAVVLGVMKSAVELNLPIHIVAILPATENLPGGSATRPGDVVRAITGQTIEITNTDAEGRMTLADAIGYARRFRPRVIVDIATLTGACGIALGKEAIAMMGNDRDYMEKMQHASEDTHERVWEMPLFQEYREYLKSDIADIKNNSGKNGSLVTSASFLHVFAGDTPWIHLDIAGTSWSDKERPYTPRGATGIGVRLMIKFLKELV
jgi:leucyl aminopeptidase